MFLSSRILITPWFFFSPVNSTSLFFSFHGFFVISSCGSDLFSFVKDILEACLLKKCWWQTLSENVFILLIYDGFVWHTIPGRQFLSQSFGGLISLISASHVTVGSNNCHLLLIFFFFFFCLLLRSLLMCSTVLWQCVKVWTFHLSWIYCSLSPRFVFHQFSKVPSFFFLCSFPSIFFSILSFKTLIRLLLHLHGLPISFNRAFIYVLFMLNAR